MLQNLTLYLDLKPGLKPELAAVARASLSFEAAVREIAFVLDPTLQFRLELDSGTEGSLKINSLIRAITAKVTDKKTLRLLAFLVLGWFLSDVRSYMTEKAIEAIIREEDTEGLSEQDISEIAREVVKALKNEAARSKVQEVYRELQGDNTITGVGIITSRKRERPVFIVPSTEFGARSTSGRDVVTTESTRTYTDTETVTLISPVLLESARRWRFSYRLGEFGAAVRDEEFLRRILFGQDYIPMTSGIVMDVLLERKEELINGIWKPKEHNILKVLSVRSGPSQIELFSSRAHSPKEEQ
jgi:hypothetical protein